MLILQGTLRQSGKITTKENGAFTKLWVEHESPRENGPADLQILEFLIPEASAVTLPAQGSPISLSVRAYPRGRDVAFQVLNVVAQEASRKN